MPLPTSTLKVVLVLASLCVLALAQTPKKDPTASVSGKVTVKGKPAAGIVVGMRLEQPGQNSPQYKATTDADGSYRINNVTSGNYVIAPVAPAMLISDAANGRGASIVVAGDSIDSINFDLMPGGVITGKVTDADGRPVIEMPIRLTQVIEKTNRDYQNSEPPTDATDDRGIYRIFGVRPGRYKVSLAENGSSVRAGIASLPLTFYPDTEDEKKAGIVEISEGAEAANIDIKVGAPLRLFTVRGRVVESETEKPVPNVRIYLAHIVIIDATHSSTSSNGETEGTSDRQGQFQVKNVPAGKYQISAYVGDRSDFKRESPVRFDVADADVTDLVVKLTRGALIEGVLVFEGRKSASDPLPGTYVRLSMNDPANGSSWGASTPVKADGTFVIGGLNPGTLNLSLGYWGHEAGAKLVRIERDGVVQPNAIQIQGAEHISGLRLVAVVSSGSVSGVIQVVNGTLPADTTFIVQIGRTDDPTPTMGSNSIRADARGHFLFEELVTGTYQIMVSAYVPNLRARPPVAKQLVTVTDGSVSEVIMRIELANP